MMGKSESCKPSEGNSLSSSCSSSGLTSISWLCDLGVLATHASDRLTDCSWPGIRIGRMASGSSRSMSGDSWRLLL